MKAPLLLLIVLAGCAAIDYSPIKADSPAPVPPPAPGPHPVCAAVPPAGTMRLAKGAACMFPIRADQPLTLTPLAIEPKESYRISVPRNQVWFDKERRNVPPHGEPGDWLMNLVAPWKRLPGSQWFALIAANLGHDGTATEPYPMHDVSTNPVLKFQHAGRLALFPNDAIVPLLGNFYSNNSGQVWVQIEHCATACAGQ